MGKGLVFWFTGLSGAGKTTIVKAAERLLVVSNKKIRIYDGDVIRQQVNKDLSFSPEHIMENNRIIAELCSKDISNRLYDYIFVAVISPFQEARDQAREIIGSSFNLIYCKSSIEKVIKRDPKGLYKKALAGEINNFIGIDQNVPYQAPKEADLVLDTENKDVESCVNKLISFIKSKENNGN